MKLKSKKETGALFDPSVGSIRANFSAMYSNNNNGVFLGIMDLTGDPIDTSYYSFTCDTTQVTSGTCISIPKGTSDLVLSFVDATETTLLTTMVDYEVVLYFEVIEDTTFNNDNSFQ
jgi:hypothetical protein